MSVAGEIRARGESNGTATLRLERGVTGVVGGDLRFPVPQQIQDNGGVTEGLKLNQ